MTTQNNLAANAQGRDHSGSTTRLALFFSAAVIPGAGHFVQRRGWLGACYMAAFLVCLTVAISTVVAPLISNLSIILDFAEKGDSEPLRVISLPRLLTWLGLSAMIYVAALVDIVTHARRQLDRRRKDLESQ